MKLELKLRKKDAKRIAKYLAKNMDAMQFDMTLTRAAGDYAGEWSGKVGDASGVNSLAGVHSIAVEPFSDGYSVSDSAEQKGEDDARP